MNAIHFFYDQYKDNAISIRRVYNFHFMSQGTEKFKAARFKKHQLADFSTSLINAQFMNFFRH